VSDKPKETIKVGGKKVTCWRQGGFWTCKVGGKQYQAWRKSGLEAMVARDKPESFKSNRKWWMW
jgi:hypothetical protein